MSGTPDAVAVNALTKVFGVTRALDGVSIGFGGGEIHGVVGENGAGKSTLMKIIGGMERPTSGRVIVRGVPATMQGVLTAQRLGISMVHQEQNLVDELSIAENIFLGREPTRWGMIDRARR